MENKTEILKSKDLSKDVNVSVYGHFGIALLVFPTKGTSHLQPEKDGLIDVLTPVLKKGKCKLYVADTICDELWWGSDLTDPHTRSKRHYEYNEFLLNDLIPYIFDDCGSLIPMITAGVGVGAYHAANTYFRRPDIFAGTLAISGNYNLQDSTGGYFDENCYFNSPVHYLPNLNDSYWLTHLMSRKHVYLMSGSGNGESPDSTTLLGNILNAKNISNHTEIKDTSYTADNESWHKIFLEVVEGRL